MVSSSSMFPSDAGPSPLDHRHIQRLPIQTRLLSQACHIFPDAASCVTGMVDALHGLLQATSSGASSAVEHQAACLDQQACGRTDITATLDAAWQTPADLLLSDVRHRPRGCDGHLCDQDVSSVPKMLDGVPSRSSIDGGVGCLRRLLCAVWIDNPGPVNSGQQLRCVEPHPWFAVSCLAILSRETIFHVRLHTRHRSEPTVIATQMSSATLRFLHDQSFAFEDPLEDEAALRWQLSRVDGAAEMLTVVDANTEVRLEVELILRGVFDQVPLRSSYSRDTRANDDGALPRALRTVEIDTMNRVAHHTASSAIAAALNNDKGQTFQTAPSIIFTYSVEGRRTGSLQWGGPVGEINLNDWICDVLRRTFYFMKQEQEGVWNVHRCTTSDGCTVLDLFSTPLPTDGSVRARCFPGLVMLAKTPADQAPRYALVGADHPAYKTISALRVLPAILGLAVVHDSRILRRLAVLRKAIDIATSTTVTLLPSLSQLLSAMPMPATTTDGEGAYPLQLDAASRRSDAETGAQRRGYLRAHGILRHVPPPRNQRQPAVSLGPKKTMICLKRYRQASVPESAELLRKQLPSLTVAEWIAQSHQGMEAITPRQLSADEIAQWRATLASAEVVGLWDKKCIVLSSPAVHPQTLFLCDQHAIHERTRLEYFVRHVASYLSCRPLSSPAQVPASSTHDCHRYGAPLRALGWRFLQQGGDGENLFMTGHPRVSIEGFIYDLSSVDALTNSIEELRDVGYMDVPETGIDIIPSAVLEVLVSRSCRGAVMFGDSLGRAEAALLVSSATAHVSKFLECSHGRPSFAVVAPNGSSHTSSPFTSY